MPAARTYSLAFCFLFAALFSFYACRLNSQKEKKDEFPFAFIPGYVSDSVYLYPDNVFTTAKKELGRYLFYDRRLSVNSTKACASCHAQQFSFTDGYAKSIGALGDLHLRNSRPLINLVFEKYLTAADSTLHFPEQQINNPMFNIHPVEMGWKGNENEILKRLKQDNLYQKMFSKAFPENKNPFTIQNVQYCITTFIKTIFSFNSTYDRYYYGKDKTGLTAAELKGKELFFSAKLNCKSCHGGIRFNKPDDRLSLYFNNGLSTFQSLQSDKGLSDMTGKDTDFGKFRVPTLRNLAFTAPYLHDGSIATLEQLMMRYEQTGCSAKDTNAQKKKDVASFKLTSQERESLVSFLLSLSDSSILTNSGYANPFTEDETRTGNQ